MLAIEESYKILSVASDATLEIFNKNGLSVNHVSTISTAKQSGSEVDSLMQEATSIINEFSPDVILVGLSGADSGIDEALIACAEKCPTYAYQDYWGDVNYGFGSLPDNYLVIDEEAKRLTLKKVNARVLVVGRPFKYDFDNNECDEDLPIDSGKNDKNIMLMFAGQPLWHLEGYARTIKKFATAISESQSFTDFIYRPHPKETLHEYNKLFKLCSDLNLDVSLDKNRLLDRAILASNVIVSCYSSCGYDVCYANTYSKKPLAGVVYFMFDDEIISFYEKQTHLSELPHSQSGVFLTVENPLEIATTIEIASNTQWQEKAWSNAVDIFDDKTSATKNVYDLMCSELELD
ncbi:MAG: hypothetical protein D8M62_01090 [Proteobacteria bacterium]|nr:hypothetical protein [Pseudomonadota bacterium]